MDNLRFDRRKYRNVRQLGPVIDLRGEIINDFRLYFPGLNVEKTPKESPEIEKKATIHSSCYSSTPICICIAGRNTIMKICKFVISYYSCSFQQDKNGPCFNINAVFFVVPIIKTMRAWLIKIQFVRRSSNIDLV